MARILAPGPRELERVSAGLGQINRLEGVIAKVDPVDSRLRVVEHSRSTVFGLLGVPDWMGPTLSCDARLIRGDTAVTENGAAQNYGKYFVVALRFMNISGEGSRLLYSSLVRLRLKPVIWTLVAILAAGAAGYTAVRLDREELIDFAVPRVAAMRFLAHEPLYRPEDGHYQFKYFPAFAAFMVPFTWPPKQVAEAIWFTLSVAMAWAFVRLALRTLPERRKSMSLLSWLTVLLMGKFLVKELAFGQFNLPLGLLLLGAVIAARDGRGLAAGGLIAAGVFIKPYALVLLPWLVWTQGWRPLVPFAIVVTAGLALPAVSYGWEGNIALLQGWYRTVTDTTAPNLLAHENISLASMWAKWLHPGPLASLLAVGSAVATVVAGLVVIKRRAVVAAPDYLEGAYFFVLIPLLSPQGWDYVLLLALPAYMCLVDRWRDTSPAWRVAALFGFITTSFVVYDLMRRPLYFFLLNWGAGSVGAVLIAASLVRLRYRALA